MKGALVVNAGAGKGDCEALARDVLEQLGSAGIDVDLALAESGEEVVAGAKRAVAQGVDFVAAGGGDGTQSAVASVLAGTGIAQGVLPMGTLNHFAKDLGIPLDLREATGVIVRGHAKAVDVGEVNGRTFINNSGLGLYPDIVLDREAQRRRLGKGKWRALASAIVHAARRYPMLAVHVQAQEQRIVRHTPFVFVGNNVYTMEGFAIGERAVLDAGKLSLYIAQQPGRFRLFVMALSALFHRLEQARDFDVVEGTEFEIHSRETRMRVSTDGEVAKMETPLVYRVRPRALRVLVAGE
ncbi:diacylglycerol/lipid kinase family protein [Ramlibacter albus]|uniref:Diacylglycerol kinase family lipid kinase n=1 Tax=Ramlibacter albus TaxID=2079448 RepID=A0A923S4D1_9BURK|nr:diacylglycerol kinase family protein [Ramlibacter albus]MBC5767375.1 diacylglycerol kinase family lipid kinase [Ramlibacter albus]